MEARAIALLQGLGFAVLCFAALWLAKFISDLRTRSVFEADRELVGGANLAVGLRRGGLYVGFAIGMQGALAGGEGAFARDLLTLAIDLATLLVFLLLAQRVTDHLVVHGVRVDDAVGSGNVAVGVVEAGVLVATGLVANGSLSGEGGGVASALVFFAVGQLALLALALAYERLTAFAVIEQVRDGNVAAGLMLAGMLVAFGILLQASLAGPFLGWVADLTAFGLSATGAIALLLLLQWPIDRIFLPGARFAQLIEEQRNVAAVAVAVSIKIALALVVASVLI